MFRGLIRHCPTCVKLAEVSPAEDDETPEPNCHVRPFGIFQLLQSDLPPVFVPVFKLELNSIPNCFVSTKMVESSTARQLLVPGANPWVAEGAETSWKNAGREPNRKVAFSYLDAPMDCVS
jgi:hypothetical protein